MSTASQYLITVAVDGNPLGTWDTRAGGEADAEISKRRPGGTNTPNLYPGQATDGDVTVTRGYERERDIELIRTLRKRCGRAQMSVTEQPLDEDGIAWGKPTVYTGRLKSVNTGDVDSDSDDPRMVELVMVCTGVA